MHHFKSHVVWSGLMLPFIIALLTGCSSVKYGGRTFPLDISATVQGQPVHATVYVVDNMDWVHAQRSVENGKDDPGLRAFLNRGDYRITQKQTPVTVYLPGKACVILAEWNRNFYKAAGTVTPGAITRIDGKPTEINAINIELQ